MAMSRKRRNEDGSYPNSTVLLSVRIIIKDTTVESESATNRLQAYGSGDLGIPRTTLIDSCHAYLLKH